MSQLVLADGTTVEIHLDTQVASNDTRNVLIPVHVLKQLVMNYYTGGGEPSIYYDRLVECGYNPNIMRQSPGNKIYIKNLECEKKAPMIIVAGDWEDDQGGRFYRDTKQITTVEQMRVLQEDSWNEWHFYKTTLPYSDASTLLYNSDDYESSEWDNSYILPLISDDEIESISDYRILDTREREEAAKILGDNNV